MRKSDSISLNLAQWCRCDNENNRLPHFPLAEKWRVQQNNIKSWLQRNLTTSDSDTIHQPKEWVHTYSNTCWTCRHGRHWFRWQNLAKCFPTQWWTDNTDEVMSPFLSFHMHEILLKVVNHENLNLRWALTAKGFCLFPVNIRLCG